MHMIHREVTISVEVCAPPPCTRAHTVVCWFSYTSYIFSLLFPSRHLNPCLHSFFCGIQLSTVFLFIPVLSHLAGELSHFSLLHNLSDFLPVMKCTLNTTGFNSITYCHSFQVSKLEKGQWEFPDREATECGISPSGLHWDQHNMSA